MNRKINSFIKSLNDKGLTLALAESITCGLAAYKLSTCKGTSEVLKGSVVCYNEDVKTGLMKIPEKVISKYTCESRKVTELLTRSLQKLIQADIHASITGLASNGGSEKKGKPVGTVFFSVCYKKRYYSEERLFRGAPAEIKEKACMALYDLINRIIYKDKR
jgi:nicotinamide-nucleotide amidase